MQAARHDDDDDGMERNMIKSDWYLTNLRSTGGYVVMIPKVSKVLFTNPSARAG